MASQVKKNLKKLGVYKEFKEEYLYQNMRIFGDTKEEAKRLLKKMLVSEVPLVELIVYNLTNKGHCYWKNIEYKLKGMK